MWRRGRRTVLVKTDQAGINQVAVAKGLTLPTDRHGQIWPYFSKTDKAKYVSARDVLAGTVDRSLIAGKMIIVGTSAVGLLDIRSTPTERIMPGVEVHAQVIETVATQAYLSRPAYLLGAELSVLLLAGLLVIVLVPIVGAKWTLLLFASIAGGAGYASWHFFVNELMLVDVVYGVIALAILYTYLTYAGYAKEEAERRQVRGAFSRYMSPAPCRTTGGRPDAA